MVIHSQPFLSTQYLPKRNADFAGTIIYDRVIRADSIEKKIDRDEHFFNRDDWFEGEDVSK